MTGTRYPQFCALARSAEIVGERWTLLIVRELMLGPKRFGDLNERLSGMSPTLLASRLSALIESKVVRRTTPPDSPRTHAYELTERGKRLRPALYELIRWGGAFLFPMRADDEFNTDWVLLALEAIARRSPSPAATIGLVVKHKGARARFLVRGGAKGTQISASDDQADAGIEARFDVLLRIISRTLTLDAAVAERLASVEGSLTLARTLPRMFDSDRASR